MDGDSPRRRTQARILANLQIRSNPNRVYRQRHQEIPLSRATPNRLFEEVFAGKWDDRPAINRILEAAEQKDIHNDVDVQKDTLRFMIEVIMCSGGMVPGRRQYHAILRSTVQSLTRNHMMRAFLQGITRLVWSGQKNLRKIFKAFFEADGEDTSHLHHASVEFIIAGILVYKVLPFASSEEGDLNEWTEKEASLLTTALFNYDPIRKPKIYTCEHTISTIPENQLRPAKREVSEASALGVAVAAEMQFSPSPSDSAEQHP